MMQNIRLDKLLPNHTATIAEVSGDIYIKQRLEDLGITPDTKISCLMKSPLGDPTAYLVRGSVIALRVDDAKNITVLTQTSEES